MTIIDDAGWVPCGVCQELVFVNHDEHCMIQLPGDRWVPAHEGCCAESTDCHCETHRPVDAVDDGEEKIDPADVMLISGYYANLPMYHIDAVYRRNGKNYVDVSPAGRSAFEPADVTTYEFGIVERNIRGEDVECLSLEEVEWSDGTKQYLRGDEP